MSDISDQPRAFSVDDILAEQAETMADANDYGSEVFEVHSADGNVQMIGMSDIPMPTDGAEVGHRLMLAHEEVEFLVAEKLHLFNRLREARERLALITRAARIYGIDAPQSTPDE